MAKDMAPDIHVRVKWDPNEPELRYDELDAYDPPPRTTGKG